MTPEQQQRVVTEAHTWLGTPYHHAAAIKGAGVDCAFLLIEVFAASGLIERFDPRPYPMDWHLHRSEERYLGQVLEHAEQVETPEPGDIALYQFGRCVSHGAIIIDWPMVIHAQRPEGCVIGEGDQGRLAGRLAGFWRLRGVSA